MNTFMYNPRSEVLYALFGTNETDYAYDDIGNHSLYPANNLNQYVDNAIEYDADGNMTRCGTWTFGWGAENRLISAAEGTTSIANAYDYKHRRVRKTVGSESHAFVYDGWNLLGETVNDTELTHYFWGLDLSDSLQGAGGVGGLLAVSQDGAMYYPVYDNNGNVTAYLDDSGNIVASYEYNAFGETIVQSGSMADEFAFRFSTKYHDNETGLYYYGYRFYNPALRIWLNRDPIEEDGGLNLYGFCENNGVNNTDFMGLSTEWIPVIGSIEALIKAKLSQYPGMDVEDYKSARNFLKSVCEANVVRLKAKFLTQFMTPNAYKAGVDAVLAILATYYPHPAVVTAATVVISVDSTAYIMVRNIATERISSTANIAKKIYCSCSSE